MKQVVTIATITTCFLVYSLLLLANESYGSLCSFTARTPYTPQDVKACFFNVPLPLSRVNQTLQAIHYSYDMFVFRDTLQHYPNAHTFLDQFDFAEFDKFNLDKWSNETLVQQLMNKWFPNDYSFHQTLSDFFASLKDSLTQYLKPECYSDWIWFLPFRLDVREGLQFFVKEIELDTYSVDGWYQTLYGESMLDQYRDWQILKINDQNVLEHVKQFAKLEVYISDDEEVNFNRAIHYDYHARVMQVYPLPKSDSLKFELKNPKTGETKTVNVNWFALPLQRFADQAHFESKCGYYKPVMERQVKQLYTIKDRLKELVHSTPSSNNSVNNFRSGPMLNAPFHHFLMKKSDEPLLLNDPSQSHSTRTTQEKASTSSFDASTQHTVEYTSSDGLFILTSFISPDTKERIAVLQISSFIPRRQDWFVLDVRHIAAKIYDIQAKKLMFDLRSNRGGFPCLALALARYFVPSLPDDTFPAMDVIHCKVGSDIYNHSSDGLYEYFKSVDDDRMLLYGNEWYTPGLIKTRNGKSSIYSDLIYVDCWDGGLFMDTKSPITFSSENMIIISNGVCVNACALFVKLLQSVNKAKVVTLGGLSNSPMDPAISYGSVLLSSTDIIETYEFIRRNEMRPNLKYSPPQLPSNALLTFSWLEFYPYSPKNALFEKSETDASVPLLIAGKSLRADHHLQIWTNQANDSSYIHEQASQFFQVCAPWQYLPNPKCKITSGEEFIENGIKGHPCDATTHKFDISKCEYFTCEDGFFMDGEEHECEFNFKPLTADTEFITKKSGSTLSSGAVVGIFLGFIVGVFALTALGTAVYTYLCIEKAESGHVALHRMT